MSIPLERLYHYIESTAQDIRGSRVLIYRFSPDGSKKIEDLTVLGALYGAQDNVSTPYERLIIPYIYCYDQEPLDYDLYKDYKQKPFPQPYINDIVENYQIDIPLSYFPEFHLNIYDHSILVHSEKRSSNLERYQQDNLIPAYYWSHALIARDWFRFAQHTSQRKQVKKTFLIYNRAWSGTREYRLKFAEHVIRLALETQCQTSINPIEPELNIHYDSHQFTNSEWRPSIPLENYFPISTAQSYYSADFDITDYEATEIEVVLETLFDDDRLHLTEKSLRPIALGQPFILAGTYGSLEYLRSYGFKTFMHVWDERYDLIENPAERLLAITELMKQIANWSPEVRENKIAQAQAIADYNKKHFFSDEFFNKITTELKDNLQLALTRLEDENTSRVFFERRKKVFAYNEIRQFFMYGENRYSPIPLRQGIIEIIWKARQYYLRSLKQI